MSKLDDAVLVPELGDKILKVLSKYSYIPTWGVLAGQAVASAIDELLGTGTPVYNDVDWFVSADEWNLDEEGNIIRLERTEYKNERLGGTVCYQMPQELHFDSYEGTLSLARRHLYCISRSEQHGLLNKVAVQWYSPPETPQDQALDLICAFDINNVQCAVNLQNRQLTVTPAYREFFRTRELKLSNLFTPVHSALRFLKKSEELKNVYSNQERALDLVSRLVRLNEGPESLARLRKEAYLNDRMYLDKDRLRKLSHKDGGFDCNFNQPTVAGLGSKGAPLTFGPKYEALFERFGQVMNERFELTERARGGLWLASNRLSAPGRIFSWAPQGQVGHPMTIAKVHEANFLPAGKQILNRRKLFQSLLEAIPPEYEYKDRKRGLEEAYLLKGDAYLEGFDSADAAKQLTTLYVEHAEFACASALPLGQQVQLMKLLRKHFKRAGVPDAWGVLRNVNSDKLLLWLQDESQLAPAMAELQGTKEPLVTALPLVQNTSGVNVVEMLSQYDLNREGNKMGHCVAGYGSSVANNHCRILSFRKGEKATERATAEWRFFEDESAEPIRLSSPELEGAVEMVTVYPLQVRLQQLRSHGNTLADEELAQAECLAREQLNQLLRERVEEMWKLIKPGSLERRRKLPITAIQPQVQNFSDLDFDDDFPF